VRGQADVPALPARRVPRVRVRARGRQARTLRARTTLGERGHAGDVEARPHPAHRSVGTPAARRADRGRAAARPRKVLSVVYHIAARADWDDASARGAYRAASLDAEGFIHCSTAAQVVVVANAFYRGRRDLVLLRIDADRVRCPVRFEAP